MNQDTTNVTDEDLGFASHRLIEVLFLGKTVPALKSAAVVLDVSNCKIISFKLEKEQEAVLSTSNLNGFQH